MTPATIAGTASRRIVSLRGQVASGAVLERFVTTEDGARLWSVLGRRDRTGDSLLCCHGGPGVADYLAPVAEMLGGRGVVRWDQRGAGRSSRDGPFTVTQFVNDLETIRRGWRLVRPVLVGHSWGANLVIHYAQNFPDQVAGVIYLCGTGVEWWPTYSAEHKRRQRARLGPQRAARLEELRSKTRTADEDDEYDLLYLETDFSDPQQAPRLARQVQATDRRYPVNGQVNAAINRDLKQLDVADQLARCELVTAPVLIVHGDDDPRPPEAVDSLATALPNVTRVMMSGAGHVPWLERPEQLKELLSSFVTTVLR